MKIEPHESKIQMETPIYPLMKVEFDKEKRTINYSTLIRKKPENSKYYYLTLVQQKWRLFEDENEYDEKRFIDLFHSHCYLFLICSTVDESLINPDGEKVSILDSNQESEIDRLTKKFHNYVS